ncbi:bile acid:sodium symporter, partial [Erythrobacter sp. HI0077]
MSFRTVLTDPMLRMLVAAIVVAALLPATGDARGWAQMVANAAIFVLFLLNGMRIARRDIVDGFAN